MEQSKYKKTHCPECKSTNITIITENSVTGGLSSHHGTVYSNISRDFWVCSDCGTKFRNIQSLEAELSKTKKNPILSGVMAFIGIIITIFFIFEIIQKPIGILFFGFFTFAAAIFSLVSLVFTFIYISRIKKMAKELSYLKEKCFN